VEAARYAAPGETGCFFPPARHGSGDRLADAPFTIFKIHSLPLRVLVDMIGGDEEQGP